MTVARANDDDRAWMADAACKGLTALFFPERGEDCAAAKAVCAGCPVRVRAARTLEQAQEAMGMPWADWQGVKEAIPPAYTEWIGEHLMHALEHAA